MGLVQTPAIVLHTFPYSESSKIVRLATRDAGVQSVVAKGVRRAKSAFGGRLSVFSEGEAHIYVREHRDLQTLARFDLTQARPDLARDLSRFAAACAIAELMIRCVPPDPSSDVFETLQIELDALMRSPPTALDPQSIRSLWQLVVALGFAPSLDACARDGMALPPAGGVAFSAPEGGVLCAQCRAGHADAELPRADWTMLRQLVMPDSVLPQLDDRRVAAHRRLLCRYIRLHLAEGRDLGALTFWERHTWLTSS